MGCCNKGGGRVIKVGKDGYYDTFKYFTSKQLSNKGKYRYCYKCQKYHTVEEYEACNSVVIEEKV
jgi:hypothetical protein